MTTCESQFGNADHGVRPMRGPSPATRFNMDRFESEVKAEFQTNSPITRHFAATCMECFLKAADEIAGQFTTARQRCFYT
jgi:hypothetical protein